MFISPIGASSISSALIRLLGAAMAAWFAIGLSAELLARFTVARFWEPWYLSLGPLSAHVPLLLIALIAGFVFGFILGLIFRPYPVRVAACAGCLGAIFMLFGGVIGLAWVIPPVGLVIGFLAGGATSGRLVHA